MDAEHTLCVEGYRHFEVTSPMMEHSSMYGPPEIGACWMVTLAKTPREARTIAVRSADFAEWVRECRSDGVTPFKGITVERTLCEHDNCYGCGPCQQCEDGD